MRNVEDVDRFLDTEDRAVEIDEDHHMMCAASAMGSFYARCGVCGDRVLRSKVLKGVCGECRQLEGSLWRQDWGG